MYIQHSNVDERTEVMHWTSPFASTMINRRYIFFSFFSPVSLTRGYGEIVTTEFAYTRILSEQWVIASASYYHDEIQSLFPCDSDCNCESLSLSLAMLYISRFGFTAIAGFSRCLYCNFVTFALSIYFVKFNFEKFRWLVIVYFSKVIYTIFWILFRFDLNGKSI